MKRLMIALTTVATAFGLYATDLSNSYSPVGKTAENWNDGLWTGDGTAGVTAANDVLEIKTGGATLKRNLQSEAAAYTIEDNLFFDVNVNMLGAGMDELPTADQLDGAKLALFLLDNTDMEGVPEQKKCTALYAIAGYGTQGGKALFKLSSDASSFGENARLTIKSYKNVIQGGSQGGFMVYLNGGQTTDTIDALNVQDVFLFDNTGAVDWTSVYAQDYLNLGSTKVTTAVSKFITQGAKGLLLSLQSGVDGESYTSVDFAGNAKLGALTVTNNGEAYDFIPADLSGVSVTFNDTELVSVDPADAIFDGLITADCTITVQSTDPSKTIIVAEGATDNGDGTFKVTIENNEGVSFTAYAAAAEIDGVKYVSLKDAIEAFASASSGAKFKLLSGNDGEHAFQNIQAWNDAEIDLNGQTIYGAGDSDFAAVIYAGYGMLTITNSASAEGKVIPVGDGIAAVVCEMDAALLITAGTFDGAIVDRNEETSGITITGGKFKSDNGEAFYLAANVADGYTATYAEGYWTVQEAAPTTAEVTISAGANVTVTVKAGETSVASGESVEVGTVLTITATPETNYELAALTVKGEAFTSGSTYTVGEGDAGNTIAIEATATAIPTFTVTFSTNTVTVAEVTLNAVLRGTALAEGQIPAFAGGAWDVDPVGAVIVCDTNFNYTIQSTVVPGEEIKTDKTPAEINADPTIKAQFLNAPAGATVDPSVYNTYFDAVAGATPGTVKFELNTAGVAALQANANSEIIKIKPNEIAALTTESGKFKVATTLPGFYYAVKQGNGIGNMKVVAAGVLAKDAKGVELDFVKYNGAGFYKIVVSPTPINPEN